MAKIDEERVRERYEKAKAAFDKLQREKRARHRREKAQADARRKTLIGELILHLVQTNQHQHDRLMTQLDAFLKDDKDRALFDLPNKNGVPASVAQNEQQVPAESHAEPPRP